MGLWYHLRFRDEMEHQVVWGFIYRGAVYEPASEWVFVETLLCCVDRIPLVLLFISIYLEPRASQVLWVAAAPWDCLIIALLFLYVQPACCWPLRAVLAPHQWSRTGNSEDLHVNEVAVERAYLCAVSVWVRTMGVFEELCLPILNHLECYRELSCS